MERAQVIKELEVLKEAFEEERDAYPICLEEAIRLLEQPEIIRCKDCRWRNDGGHWLGCSVLNTDDDNYCSMAERRTNESD